MPAASALVPELVDHEQISTAIALDRSIFHATRLAGPALGGWLIAWLGMSSAFYANALSFGALMVALVVIRPRPRSEEEARKEAAHDAGIKEGLTYVRNDQQTLTMISLLAIATLCISPFFMIMMPLYSMNVLHISASQHGYLMGASGAGAFAGSLWLLNIRRDRRRAWLYVAVGLIGAAMFTLSVAPTPSRPAICRDDHPDPGNVHRLWTGQHHRPGACAGSHSGARFSGGDAQLLWRAAVFRDHGHVGHSRIWVGLRLAMACAAAPSAFGSALLLFKHSAFRRGLAKPPSDRACRRRSPEAP